MLRNMINNIKKSVCKANEDFIFGTDFADKMGWNELDDIRRTNGICEFFLSWDYKEDERDRKYRKVEQWHF